MIMKYDYDLIVIGGGSAGISLANQSAKYNKKICLFEKRGKYFGEWLKIFPNSGEIFHKIR